MSPRPLSVTSSSSSVPFGSFASTHAIAWVLANAAAGDDPLELVTLSGRGDKDLAEVLEKLA